ncbi:uncharacterized protein LOC101896405 [Musca domestica]|uniref:Uncharacterized protein LOC101896405 n=1 Tax=Musca domestica TaxID=7370 RepID=A0ABM3USM4_MUSDO|nr:uncharacterized protein LOC101896405 [Musca domestica]
MNSLCGFRLSTVGIVIGWFNLIGSIFSTIVLCVAFSRLDDLVKLIQDNLDNGANAVDNVGIRTAVIITLCVYLTTSVTNVIASSLLIVGTVKERHLLLTPWLVNAYIFIFFNVLNFIYMIYVAIAKGLPVGSTLGTIIGTALSLVIQLIIWNAIYSLFKQIRANRDLQQRLLPTTSAAQYPNYTKMPPTVE